MSMTLASFFSYTFRGVETPRNNIGRAYGTIFRHFNNAGTVL